MSEFSIALRTRKKFSAESHFFQSLNCDRWVSDIHVISEITATTPIYSLNFFWSSLRRSLISLLICEFCKNVKLFLFPSFFPCFESVSELSCWNISEFWIFCDTILSSDPSTYLDHICFEVLSWVYFFFLFEFECCHKVKKLWIS